MKTLTRHLNSRPELFYEVIGVTNQKLWRVLRIELVDYDLPCDHPVQSFHIFNAKYAEKVIILKKRYHRKLLRIFYSNLNLDYN